MGYVEAVLSTLLVNNWENASVLNTMDDNTYTLTNNSNSFANGTYIVSASSHTTHGGMQLYGLFQSTGNFGHLFSDNGKYNITTGYYESTIKTSADGTDYNGEWVQYGAWFG